MTGLTRGGATTAAEAVRERCRVLGLPTWRCDHTGRLTADPEERGPLGLWLRSSTISKLISAAAVRWGNQKDPDLAELFAGCWVIPLVEEHRRERVGYTIAMVLGEQALGDEWFQAACGAAQLDVRAIKTALSPSARFDETSARVTATMLRWMLRDLSHEQESQDTIAGFTRQLTDGFETIDLLYSLGRSMNDLSKPAQFITDLCQRLQGSMAFAWMAAWFGADPKVERIVGDRLFLAGSCSLGPAELNAALHALASRSLSSGGEGKSMILSEMNGRAFSGGAQLLVQPVVRGGRTVGMLIGGDKGGDDPQVSSYDIHLLEAAAGYVGSFVENATLYDDQRAMFMGTLRAMTATIDAKDRYTRGHSERVAHLSRMLALASGLDTSTADRLHICGIVHDVGKIGVPEAVLGKRGRLTDEEFTQIKLHPEIGFSILRDIPLLEDILPGVLHHHERYDGKGYPHGLSGEAIPLFARIIALADTFDAMSSTRSYRAAMPREKVLEEIQKCAGAQFDPKLAPLFVKLDFTEYDEMVRRHGAADTGHPES